MSFSDRVLGFGAFPNRDTTYEIDQSLSFDSASGPYLHRTPGSAGNQKTWTFSAWIKGNFTNSYVFGVYDNSTGNDANYGLIWFEGNLLKYQGWSTSWRITNRQFRDPSAWYHIIVAQDTTQSTADDRVKIYVNGVQETSFDTKNNPSEDADLAINKTHQTRVGSLNVSSPTSFAGLMAEVNFVDGSQLTPSDFGETNADTNQWVPKKYAGSYGTNGFYLKFVSGALGTDSSGEGNNYTSVNLDNYDVVSDTPTNNFATLNPLWTSTVTTLTQGNLKLTQSSNADDSMIATIGVSTGKWYWEIFNADGNTNVGIANNAASRSDYVGADANGWSYFIDGNKYNGGSASSYGATYTDDDIIGVALDMDDGTLVFYKNGVSQGTAFSSLSGTMFPALSTSGASHDVINFISFGQNPTFNNSTTAGGNADGNGVGNFKYSVPSGHLALCTSNLPTPTVTKGTDYFNTVLYTGNGSTASISGVGFQPDLVWIKNRSAADNHKLTDSVRGATEEIESNSDDAAATNADGLTSFASDGFALGDDDEYNTNTENYASWNWKVGAVPTTDNSASAGATPTAGSVKIDGSNLGSALAGSIAATRLTANTTAGFSILTYAGGSGTVAHGLGVAPKLVLQKKHDSTGDWLSYTSAVDGTADVIRLNTTAAAVAADPATLATSTVFSSLIGGNNVIAYCFAEVAGYSKFGTYKGNGSADGPFVYTGFKPAWVVMKRTDDTSSWEVLDNKRQAYAGNKRYLDLDLNLAATENATNGTALDLLSNGFKHRDGVSTGTKNVDGATYLYIAFAEFPFKYSNAR